MEIKRCDKCIYYTEGLCRMPVWYEGKYIGIREVRPDDRCNLYEERKSDDPE